MPKFYVCCAWHDFPEGGTYATTVQAKNHAEALELCHREMAESYADQGDNEPASCNNCGNTDQDATVPTTCIDCGSTDWDPGVDAVEEMLKSSYREDWTEIDCYKVEDSTEGQLLADIIRVYNEPGGFTLVRPLIEKAREHLYG